MAFSLQRKFVKRCKLCVITHSILSLYCRCEVVVSSNEPCPQYVALKNILTKQIYRLQTNKSPHIVKFMLTTIDQLKNLLLLVNRENAY